jgi:uncharacterized protein GlcG (DUF336 family)
MKSMKWLVLAGLLAGVPCSAYAQSAVVNVRTLSYDAALDLATTTVQACRKAGFFVTVTVLDRLGRTKIVLHDDNANPHTVENSYRKAYTSLTSRIPSGEYGKRNVANPQSVGALSLANITTLEGALPIKAGNDVVGSIGVSGAPGGDKDAACAQVGLDKIAKGLN